MPEWLTTITDHAGTFIFEGYVFVAHFIASAMSSITKSATANGGRISRWFRKGIDFLALNIGHATPQQTSEDTYVELSEVKLENERLRKIVNLHRRDNEGLRDRQFETDTKHKEMINELKADHRSAAGKLRREAQEYLEKIDKLERELRGGKPPTSKTRTRKKVIKDLPQITMSDLSGEEIKELD